MIPWDKLPKSLQKYLLISIILSGSAATNGCRSPIICDPVPPPPTSTVPVTNTPIIHGDTAPPPSLTPRPTATPAFTPIICDPMPPPTISSRGSPTPMICDPAPPPSIVRPGRQFHPTSAVTTVDTTLQGARVEGQVLDAQGKPVPGIQITARIGPNMFYAGTDQDGRYTLDLLQYGDYDIFVGDDQKDAVHIRIAQYDRNTIDWLLVSTTSHLRLPLAEIRTVAINRIGDLAFQADTPWPGAQLFWTISGGALSQEGDRVTWTPPPATGRYLLQVVADWGPEGLAVSASVLLVGEDGGITIV